MFTVFVSDTCLRPRFWRCCDHWSRCLEIPVPKLDCDDEDMACVAPRSSPLCFACRTSQTFQLSSICQLFPSSRDRRYFPSANSDKTLGEIPMRAADGCWHGVHSRFTRALPCSARGLPRAPPVFQASLAIAARSKITDTTACRLRMRPGVSERQFSDLGVSK